MTPAWEAEYRHALWVWGYDPVEDMIAEDVSGNWRRTGPGTWEYFPPEATQSAAYKDQCAYQVRHFGRVLDPKEPTP